MDGFAIRVEGLTKVYPVVRARGGAGSVREALAGTASKLLAPWKRDGQAATDSFRALDDVSFDVPRGEKLGIVGRNGAGKSTLLKILSRVTAPTHGRAEIAGRVTSLLEVGTGFHPELTGRENVFLNGAILGIPHATVKRLFDDIVQFAGVEQFLETPVKRYSSGMKARLGFAISSHLDSDVMIVDEVLAVGDADFRRRCVAKMKDITRSGDRTVIFVSHDLGSVSELCTSAIYLSGGRLLTSGPTDDVIAAYLGDVQARPTLTKAAMGITDFSLIGASTAYVPVDGDVTLDMTIASRSDVGPVRAVLNVLDTSGRAVICYDSGSGSEAIDIQEGINRTRFTIASPRLRRGDYFLEAKFHLSASDECILDVSEFRAFGVSDKAVSEAGDDVVDTGRGVIRPVMTLRRIA